MMCLLIGKSRNRRKNGKVTKSYIGNSKGFREVKNDPTISDSVFKSNQDAVQKIIGVMKAAKLDPIEVLRYE